jgi:glutaredoxin
VTAPIEVVLVTNPGCHYCDDALRLLDDIGERIPLRIRTLPLSSDEGRVLVVRHRVPFPPILLVNGHFFGYGRISRRKLERRLAETTNALEV